MILNWRDTDHPQGGGSEVFVEEVARRLAHDGRPVTIFCADHGAAPREEVRDGVRFIRRGSWWTVYAWAALYHLRGKFGPHEVVVDVQNAVPFFSPLFCGRPVIALVHHIHREQWRMLFGRRIAQAGWWVESRLTPKLYRKATYVAVSMATKADLVSLGVDPERIVVVRNGGLEDVGMPAPKAPEPTIVYLGRLVPHKRVEILFEAAARLRQRFPHLRVRVIGRGGWEGRLRRSCRALGVDDLVSFEGYVPGPDKLRILADSWALALPSVKEGWGLAVMEAAAVGTPSVAFRVGGLEESVVHEQTGILADTTEELIEGLARLLASAELRKSMGEAARLRAATFRWAETVTELEAVLDDAAERLRPASRERIANRLVILEPGSV